MEIVKKLSFTLLLLICTGIPREAAAQYGDSSGTPFFVGFNLMSSTYLLLRAGKPAKGTGWGIEPHFRYKISDIFAVSMAGGVSTTGAIIDYFHNENIYSKGWFVKPGVWLIGEYAPPVSFILGLEYYQAGIDKWGDQVDIRIVQDNGGYNLIKEYTPYHFYYNYQGIDLSCGTEITFFNHLTIQSGLQFLYIFNIPQDDYGNFDVEYIPNFGEVRHPQDDEWIVFREFNYKLYFNVGYSF